MLSSGRYILAYTSERKMNERIKFYSSLIRLIKLINVANVSLIACGIINSLSNLHIPSYK